MFLTLIKTKREGEKAEEKEVCYRRTGEQSAVYLIREEIKSKRSNDRLGKRKSEYTITVYPPTHNPIKNIIKSKTVIRMFCVKISFCQYLMDGLSTVGGAYLQEIDS